MLFAILKAFGLDIPARIEELRTRIERRVEDVAGEAKQALQQAVVIAVLGLCAAMTALAAIAIGLVALFRWVSDNFGVFVGYGVVAGVLVLVTLILGVVAWARSRPAPRPPRPAEDVPPAALHSAEAARPLSSDATVALAPPAAGQGGAASATASPDSEVSPGGEWSKLLAFLLPLLMKSPASGNIVMDALLAVARPAGRKTAGEALGGAAALIRQGNRMHLLGTVAGAVFFGWLLSRRSLQWPAGPWSRWSRTMEQDTGKAADRTSADWAQTSRTASEAARRATQQAGAAASGTMRQAGSAVQNLRSEIKGIQDMLANFAVQSGREAAASARSAAGAAAAQLGAVAGEVAKSGSNAAAAAGEQAKSLASDAEGMARRNPLGIIAGAIIIGVLIGTFGRRR